MKTRWSVKLADIIAKRMIKIGGIGTIAALSLLFLFLLYVVVPLFKSASVQWITNFAR